MPAVLVLMFAGIMWCCGFLAAFVPHYSAPEFHVKTGEGICRPLEVKNVKGEEFYLILNSQSKWVWINRKGIDK